VRIDQGNITGFVLKAESSDHKGLLFVSENEDVDRMVKDVCKFLRNHKVDVRQYAIAIGQDMTPGQACKAVRECARIMTEIARERKP